MSTESECSRSGRWRAGRLTGRLELHDRALLRGTIGTAFLNGSTTVLNLVVVLVLARLLGAEEFGAYTYALAWALLLTVPATLGLTPLIVRNVAAFREQRSWGLLRGLLRRANEAVALSSAVCVGVGAVVAVVLNHDDPELLRPLLLALALVPIIAFTSIRQSAMQGLNHVVLGRVPEALLGPCLFLLAVAATYALQADWVSSAEVIAVQGVAFTAALAAGAFLLHRKLPADVHAARAAFETRDWARSAAPLLLFSFIQAINAQIEVLLLAVLKNATDAGLYSVATRVTGLITFALVAASYPIAPMLARLHAAGETATLRRFVRRAAIAVFVASVPVAAIVVLLSNWLLRLFGAEFEGGQTALVILVAGQLVFAATGIAGTVLVMTGHESLLARGAVVTAIVNVLLNSILIPSFGLDGAALSSTLAVTVGSAMFVYYARRRAGVPSSAFGV